MVGFDQKRLHPDELAFTQVLDRRPAAGLVALSGRNAGLVLEIDEHLRGEGFRCPIRGGRAEVVLDGVLQPAVVWRGSLSGDPTPIVNRTVLFDGSER